MKLCYCINVVERHMVVHPLLSPAVSRLGRSVYPVDAFDLLKDKSFPLVGVDRRILTILCAYQGLHGYRINGSMAFELLEKLLETGRVFWVRKQDKPLKKARSVKSTPVWQVNETGDLFHGGYDYPSGMTLVPCSPPAVIDEQKARVHFLDVHMSAAACSEWHSRRPMELSACVAFVKRLCDEYPKVSFPPPPTLELLVIDDENPTPVLVIEKFDNHLSDNKLWGLTMSLHFDYRGACVYPADENERVRHVSGDYLYDMRRQQDVEGEYVRMLEDWGLTRETRMGFDLFASAHARRCYQPDAARKRHWQLVFDELLPLLEKHGWQIRHQVPGAIHSVQDSEWYTTAESKSDQWFSVETGVLVDGQQVNLLPLIQSLLARCMRPGDDGIEETLAASSYPVMVGEHILIIPGGRLLLILRNLFELFSQDALQKDGSLRVDKLRMPELQGMFDERPPFDEHIERLCEAHRQGLSIAPAQPPDDLLAELRPYQKLGLGWLEFLHAHRFGGILADDMGLGKTVQTLALLLKLKKKKQLKKPVLIVAPTSVLPNWRHEVERFAPLLSCALHHGADRAKNREDTLRHDIILTSYTLLRNDELWLSRQAFSWIILDEAQYIKNARSRTVKALAKINGEYRLCLTGTPMENHLGELWSLFNFVMPGYLGSYAHFKRVFQTPIEQHGHTLLRESLKRRIRPFMLRRSKSLVEKELPDKIEIIETLSLSEEQRDLYEVVRLAMTERIQEEMTAKGFARSRIMILDALLKLRQICCDPRLRDKKVTKLDASCKMTWLRDQLPEMIEEGRRILLFSQFTSMLELIEKWMVAARIDFVKLTGSTVDRETVVRQFQSGDIPVFLISLKAGGTGLNLTAADTVIHYDPWWNPAAENQATDRAHRIGQNKHVFVYKLVAEDSVEERILQLQKRKADLADAILEKSAAKKSLTFSEEDLAYLLAPIGGHPA
ncbi:MAG: DEAD/DEAH box helicase [Spartobacteria bacterium]|nr:DEAD/DEAH box helicase [Spartobacteria bacterium]